MRQYRVFIKDGLDLAGMPIANAICTSFTVRRDLLGSQTSSFSLLTSVSNVKEGDVLGLVDPFGTVVYNGVIKSIDSDITCSQMLSLFNDTWKWHDPSATTIEGKIKSIIQSDFINSSDPLIADKFPFTVSTTSSTAGTFEQHYYNWTETVETTDSDGKTKKERIDHEDISQKYTQNLEDFLYTLYTQYGVIVDIVVPFSGTPTIKIGKATASAIKIGNNAIPIANMLPLTEIVETNKLLVYSKDGSTLRGQFYGTRNGITTNSSDPLRLPVIKTKYVFDDDKDPAEVVKSYLQEEMLNHKVEFDVYLDNRLYNFYEWELGQPFELWYNTNYFETVFTAYELSQANGGELEVANITCGKVRNSLTDIFNKVGYAW